MPGTDLTACLNSLSRPDLLMAQWNDFNAQYLPLTSVDQRYNVAAESFAIPETGTNYRMTFIADQLTPVLHKDAAELKELLGADVKSEPETLSAFAAQTLRDKYLRPDIGITGTNFILAEQGAVAVTEKEGNVMLAASRPKIHIVIAGINKVIPSIHDLHVIWPLLATYGTGQRITSYNFILGGPKKNGETNGPSQMYVVLIDNGRTKVIAEEVQRSMMSCIRCGACCYADPVYSAIGGHPYHSTWMDPQATVIHPHLYGMQCHAFLSHLSTLSASDTENCPVNINFHKLLLDNRKRYVDSDHIAATDKIFYFLWKNAMMKRDVSKWKSLKPRKYFIDNIFFKSPMDLRDMKAPEKETFNDQ